MNYKLLHEADGIDAILINYGYQFWRLPKYTSKNVYC